MGEMRMPRNFTSKWPMVRIGEYCEVVTGGTPSTKKSEYWEHGKIPWLTSESLRDGDIKSASKFITKSGLDNSSATMMPVNSVLIALTGATTGRVGHLRLDSSANQSVTGIIAGKNVDARYLFYWLKSIRWIILEQMWGGGQPHISQGYVKSILFPLAPYEEQERIAAILDKADEIKSSSKSVPHLHQQLILSTFNEMFGDLRINSKSWPEKSISELCNRVNVGYVGPLTPLYVESGIRCLRGLNIKRGRISSDNIKQISPESHENLLKKSRLNAGDVVAIRTGNAGVSAVISEEYDDINCADLIIMTPGSEIEPSYLCEFLNQKFGDADSIQGAVGAIQKHFNIGSAKKVMVPLPPLKLQIQYSQIIKAVSQLNNQNELAENTSLSLAQEMFI